MNLRDLLDHLDATPNDPNDERLDFEAVVTGDELEHIHPYFSFEEDIRNDHDKQQVVLTVS